MLKRETICRVTHPTTRRSSNLVLVICLGDCQWVVMFLPFGAGSGLFHYAHDAVIQTHYERNCFANTSVTIDLFSLTSREDVPYRFGRTTSLRSILHTSWYIIPNSPHISAIRHHRQDIPIDSSKDSDIAHNLVPLSSLVLISPYLALCLLFRLNFTMEGSCSPSVPLVQSIQTCSKRHTSTKMRRRKGWAGLATKSAVQNQQLQPS